MHQVVERLWQFRGEAISTARGEVPTAYEFKAQCKGLSTREAKAKRAGLVESLLDDHKFIYKAGYN